MPGDARRPAREPAIGPAPGRLEAVREFVNTLDVEAGTDELSSPEALAAWLSGHALTGSDDGQANYATAGDLRRALALREALREVLLAHVGRARPAGGAVAELNSLAAGLPARLAIGPGGEVCAAAGGSGPAAGLAALLVIAAEATTLGTWPRLKICSADDCRWAFYDRSPTRSGCWCSMAGCGARAKSRAYRRRAAARG